TGAVLVAPIVGDIRRLMSLDVDTSSEAGIAARTYAAGLAEDISDEGIVLLKNTERALPLTTDAVNVFSFASFNLRFGGGGSGGSDTSTAVNLYDALSEQGFTWNPELHRTLVDAGAQEQAGAASGAGAIVDLVLGNAKENEPAPDYLTDAVMAQAREYSDTALVVIGNDGVESSDFEVAELRLVAAQRTMLDLITASFDNVIVIVNSGNQMELSFLEEYPQITGALWIGTPGPRGAVSLAKILAGEINPSGRLTDTYVHDVTSAPATINFGDFKYDNADRAFLNYAEGIYVGYRYYETRYADDPAGYADVVQFPFGYGLSYTTFDWAATDPVITADEVSVQVTVTNTGEVAGRDVVEVYFAAPYTPGGIEKSAVELGGYAKTSLLEPGASETVTVAFPLRDLASWDTNGAGGYILEAGSYQIRVSTDVHTPLISFDHEVAEMVTFTTDADTGATLKNRFDYAEGDLTYLSRHDWDGTYPDVADNNHTAPPEILDKLTYSGEPAPGEEPTYGADNGLMLADLTGLPFEDPQWDAFLDQLTLDELIDIFAYGAYQTEPVDRLGIPSAKLLDGPAGLNFFFGGFTAASFPTEVVLGATWNRDLARQLGEAVGTEANAYGVQGWYAPGMNIHRTALGGRNFEFFSEDPVISGTMGASIVEGAQSKGLLVFMKHFVLNDQEINARSGINQFLDEQALREIYLQPFKITVKEADVNGVMSSFINVGGVWAGGNPELLSGVLRGEWGFDGVVSTDAVLGTFMDANLAVREGNDLMLAVMGHTVVGTMKDAYADDPVGIGNGLRDRVHTWLYWLLRTDAVS
ncbi:MAG: glycoside hydrolase family 3 protein, partial [Propioniciclava sp.]